MIITRTDQPVDGVDTLTFNVGLTLFRINDRVYTLGTLNYKVNPDYMLTDFLNYSIKNSFKPLK